MQFFLFASCQVLVSRIRIRFRKIFQPDLDPNYLKKDPQLCGILMHFLNQTARIRKTNLNKKTWILFIYITVSILFYLDFLLIFYILYFVLLTKFMHSMINYKLIKAA